MAITSIRLVVVGSGDEKIDLTKFLELVHSTCHSTWLSNVVIKCLYNQDYMTTQERT